MSIFLGDHRAAFGIVSISGVAAVIEWRNKSIQKPNNESYDANIIPTLTGAKVSIIVIQSFTSSHGAIFLVIVISFLICPMSWLKILTTCWHNDEVCTGALVCWILTGVYDVGVLHLLLNF